MDFTPILIWWLTLFVVGLIGWPLAHSLLGGLPDRGYTFARPVALLFGGYVLWLGASFRLLQNNVGGIVVSLALVLGVGLLWHRRQVARAEAPPLLTWLKQQWRYALLAEMLFAAGFIGWAIYKAYNPNIETAGGEKWMEIAFINGILRSSHFPPQDPWLSGFGISYYYFGYVLMAMLTQLTGLATHVAFNLYAPTLLAMTLCGAFGIGSNLVSIAANSPLATGKMETEGAPPLAALLTGLASALFVALLGNLIGVLEVLHKRGLLPAQFWVWLDIRDLKIPPAGPADSWIPDRFIWWWRGSRVLTDYNLAGREQEVIDEFPFFSFLLADIHPHVLALPFVLLVTALALNLLQRSAISHQPSAAKETLPPTDNEQLTTDNPQSTIDKLRQILENSWRDMSGFSGGRLGFGLLAVAVGGLSFLNTWDFPIYLGVTGLAFTAAVAAKRRNWNEAVLHGAIGTAALGAAGVALYLPFYATFQSQARGILPNLWNPTRLPQFFVFFGVFLVAVVALLAVLSRQDKRWRQHIGWTVPLTVLAPALVMLVALTGVLISPAGRDYIQDIINNPEVQAVIGGDTIGAMVRESLGRRLLNPWTFLLLGGLLGWALALFAGRGLPGHQPKNGDDSGGVAAQFALILLLVGLALPLVVEFIYLRDNFGIRMNTIFKFYFQAWVLLALASAFALYYVSANLSAAPRLAWQAAMLLLVLAGLVYPVLAVLNKTNNFGSEPTLNGIAWIAEARPGDYAAIEWLRQNAPPDAVLLEAPGSGYAAYQYTGRISALTGVPTLLGWGGHQSQWRGNYDEPARREPDIEQLFTTLDYRQAQALLDKYGITYVVIGGLERERYSPRGLQKFADFMTPVFQQDDVVIFER
ncbi:MAG: DUF2298 domain-containing protein [Anaerolineae bacterium]